MKTAFRVTYRAYGFSECLSFEVMALNHGAARELCRDSLTMVYGRNPIIVSVVAI